MSGHGRPFRWLNGFSYGNVVVASLVGVAWSLWGLLGLNQTFWYVVYVYIWTSILFSFLPGMTFAIMIGLNWGLVLDVRNQDRQVKKLGLAGVLEAPWADQRAKTRALNAVTLLLGPGLWAWGLFFVAFVCLWPLPDKDKAPAFFFPVPGLEQRAPVAWAVFLCFLWTLLVGCTCVWLHRLRRGEERLRVVARLQSSLGKSAEQPDEVTYNQIAQIEQVAQIEQAQISAARADSVKSFSPAEIDIGENVRTDAGQELPKFAVSYTKDAQAACDKLSEKARAALRTIDNELSEDPTHRATKLDNGTFIYKYPTPAIQLTCKLVGKIVYVIHVVVPALPAAKLFISYCHEDKDYLDQLKKYLKELEIKDQVKIWDDRDIPPGNQWADEIQNSISSAKAAVLLVTQDFLASDFIRHEELPQFLKAAKSPAFSLLWIAVKPSTYKNSEISSFQALNNPEEPLDGLSPPDQNKEYVAIFEKIKDEGAI